MKLAKLFFVLIVSGLLISAAAWGETRGITKTEIHVGATSDLSGPLALWGVPSINGLNLRFDEENTKGGINGRKIVFHVVDAKYQVPLAVKGSTKLIHRDKIFAMIGNLGTPHNLAINPTLFKMNIPNLFPYSGAKSMYDPLHPLKFSLFVGYYEQIRGAMIHFKKELDIKNVCYQGASSDYGQEVEDGFRAGASELGLNISVVGHHKTTETDFVGTATKIKNSDCDLLAMGTTVKDTIILYSTLRKLGWKKPVVASMVPYLPLVAAAADGAMEGLYISGPFYLAEGDVSPWVKNFQEKFKKRFGKMPAIQAQSAYVMADIFIQAMKTLGDDITVERLTAALENISHYEDPFDGPNLSFSKTKHAATDMLVLSQVKNKKWVVVKKDLPY